MALVAAPVITLGLCLGRRQSLAAGLGQQEAKKTKKNDKSSSINDPRFVAGYKTAYATIYDRNDYAAAIDQLKALGHDENAAVANLIGYSYRKLGDYKVSQVWYERALQGRSEPRQDLAVLRAVAARTGQPRTGANTI